MLNAFPRLLFFQKKNVFTGDHRGMRMRLAPVQPEEGARFLRAWVWPEPLCFTAVLREREAIKAAEAAPAPAEAAERAPAAEAALGPAEAAEAAEIEKPESEADAVYPLFTADFALDEDGLAAACDWVRRMYDEQLPLWKAHDREPVV